MKPKITLILCVRNAGPSLPRLLNSVLKQKSLPGYELIVTDSQSTDGSPQIIKSEKLKVKNLRFIKVRPENFGHGKTRNQLIKTARGEIIVFISQDIGIKSDLWLFNLLKPFDDKKIAGVFARQTPYGNTNPYERFFYAQAYPDKPRIISNKNGVKFSTTSIFFSMVCGAARKNLLLKYPFPVDKDTAIDQWWAKDVLNEGYKIIYTTESAVYHSHNYSFSELLKRNYQSAKSLRGFPKESILKSIISLLSYYKKETVYVYKNGKIKDLIWMILYEKARMLGFMVGSIW